MGRLEILLSCTGADTAKICRRPNAGSGTGHGRERRLLGCLSIPYAFYTVVHRYSRYKGKVSMRDALFCLIRGSCDKNVFDSDLYKRLKAKKES